MRTHIGSDFENFLKDEGIYEDVEAAAMADNTNLIIKNNDELNAALKLVGPMFEQEPEIDPETPEGRRFIALCTAIEAYESIHYPIEPVSPHSILAFIMDQRGVTSADLASVVEHQILAAILDGKEKISEELAAALAAYFNVSPDYFISSR